MDHKTNTRLVFAPIVFLAPLVGACGGATQPPELFVVSAADTGPNFPGKVSVFGPDAHLLRALGNLTALGAPDHLAIDAVHHELFIASGYGITVHDTTANGNVAPLRIIGQAHGNRSASPLGGRFAVDPDHDELVVPCYNASFSDLDTCVFSRTASGESTPLRAFNDSSQPPLSYEHAIAIDAANDEILSTNVNNDLIAVYPRTGNGDIRPLRTIGGPSTGLSKPTNIAVDPVHDEIFVANSSSGSVTVYPRTASGDIAPLRVILGPSGPLALDLAKGELYVAERDVNFQSVSVYARTAEGNAAPLRTQSLSGYAAGMTLDATNQEIFASDASASAVSAYATDAATPLRSIAGPADFPTGWGIAVDPMQHELYLLDYAENPNSIMPRIVVFDQRPSTASSRPLRSFNLRIPLTAPARPTSMSLDPRNGEVLVTITQGGPCTNPFVCHYDYPEGVAVYRTDASGDALPDRVLHGSATGLQYPSSVAVDAVHDEMFVTYGDTVAVFNRSFFENDTPKRSLSGDGTGLHAPRGIRVEPDRNEIFVANANDAITIYGREFSGNVSFLRAIYGDATGLNGLTDIAVDVAGGEIYAANAGVVTVYDIAANGNIAPRRALSSSSTGWVIERPWNLALSPTVPFTDPTVRP